MSTCQPVNLPTSQQINQPTPPPRAVPLRTVLDMSAARTIAFHTLGCKLNFSETSSIARLMETEGFERKEFTDLADVYVINTCSVTENADKECRQLVRRIQRKAPESFVVIMGCYAQLKPEEIAQIQGVDLVLGAAEKFQLARHLREYTKGDSAKICSCDIDDVAGFNSAYSLADRTRTFLKVQDGCDYNCSFCTIPLARGHSRSDSIAGVLGKVKEIEEQGAQEIVLTGINLGDFGKGYDGGKRREENFWELMQALEEKTSIPRYRISSIEPNLLTEEMIRFVAASKRFMPHFHIPLQSGSNEVLGQMRRRYRRELYAERIGIIKEVMPHAAIGVDVIVGFPGETDRHFQETYDFLHDLDVTYFHVFTYSERANTLALDIDPVVPMPMRHERNKLLRQLSFQKNRFFHEQHLGQQRPVLWEESNRNGVMEGYTDNYIRAQAAFDEKLAGKIALWRVV